MSSDNVTDSALRDHQTDGLAEDLLSSVSIIRRRLRQSTQLSEITSTQMEVLRLIYDHPELSAAKLASTLHVAPNTISGLTRQLVDLEFVVRRRDPSDRRLAFFDVTPAGKSYVEAYRDFRFSTFRAAFDELSSGERASLSDAAPALRALAEQLAK